MSSEAAKNDATTQASKIIIRTAVPSDAAWLARLHTEALPNAFLPTLGPRFMRRLYLGLIDDPGGVILVAEQDGKRVGMATGVASVPRFYRRFFRRHGIQAAFAAGTRIIRPSVIRRARETSRYPKMTTAYPDAEFLTWNVEPEGRGKGLGVRLSHAMVEGLCAKGASEVKAFAYADNETLNHVFTKTGWERGGLINLHSGGGPSTLWVIRCPSS